MATHPTGITVDVVGIQAGDRGRSCEHHDVCGSVLQVDSLVRFRAVQVVVKGKEETALAVHWATDGIDRCRVGFLPRHLVKHRQDCNGKLAQIVEFLDESDSSSERAKSHRNKGIAKAVLAQTGSNLKREAAAPTEKPAKKKKSTEDAGAQTPPPTPPAKSNDEEDTNGE